MTNDVFDMLRTAVTVARERQVRRLDELRTVLADMFPGKEPQIEEAIKAWAVYARCTE